MPETVFRSPGFFEQEIDLSQQVQEPVGIPAGIIGTSVKGPAFVPITVGSFADFKTKFGGLDTKRFGPYAANEFLKNRNGLTYLRVLGAGSNKEVAHIEKTRLTGQVRNAGFVVTGSSGDDSTTLGGDIVTRRNGMVQFITARHISEPTNETAGFPVFSDNDSYNSTLGQQHLIRGAVFMAAGTRLMVGAFGDAFSDSGSDGPKSIDTSERFKIFISSSAGVSFDNDDSNAGVNILTASLNPDSVHYIGKILNTDPERFSTTKHLLYLDLPVDAQLASASTVAVLSGSTSTSAVSGDTSLTFEDMYGHFDTRFSTPSTTMFISQPFGTKEYDLFRIESRSDGQYDNDQLKISISNLRVSTDPRDEYGVFSLLVRAFDDTDVNPQIIEQYSNISLNPLAENYIGRMIGDKRVLYNFDADQDEERRLILEGKYANRSSLVRVVIHPDVEAGRVSAKALPFGFRGPEVLKTADSLDDISPSVRIIGSGALGSLSGSIVPPLPYRFKVTRGNVNTSPTFAGEPGTTEVVDGRYFWGVKTERNKAPLNANVTEETNTLVSNYTKFMGIKDLDALVTGSGADSLNNNKFTMARVALFNGAVADVTGTVSNHILDTAYVRNGTVDPSAYTVNDGFRDRVTFASLVHDTTPSTFNKFSEFAKFTNIMGGGFDGLNIMDSDAARMNDKSTSTATGGGAVTSYVPTGFGVNQSGTGRDHNGVNAYRVAVNIVTDEMASNINLLAIPGIREPLVTDEAADAAKDYGMALYIMDLEEYDPDTVRLFDDSTDKPGVRSTSEQFDTRALDNNYVATYFPRVVIEDTANNQQIKVPASVAALGAIGFNDKVGYPWFAPAGFNRAALDFVNNVDVRLNSGDRDVLYEARINPIATFPREGYVIFGQKTLQFARSALDRVNVRRLLLEVKRTVTTEADKFVFENNTSATRSKFVSQVVPKLSTIQAQAGVESFRVIMDESNNTQADVESNRLNGKIVIVPTRAIEFISLDFIVTNAGVTFPS